MKRNRNIHFIQNTTSVFDAAPPLAKPWLRTAPALSEKLYWVVHKNFITSH